MAEIGASEDANPFDQIDPNRTDVGGTGEDNPFDAIGPSIGPQGSAIGAFGRGVERSAIPAIGSIPAIGAGAEIGAAAGAPLGPVGVAAGGIIGGFAGALAGSTALSSAQNWALSKLPDSWREAIGMDDRQERIDQGEHPIASFLGGLVPYAVTMRPGAVPTKALPENATSLQRILAHPATARVFGGAAMGGMELGQEEASHEDLDWRKVAISTGFGLVFNRPTKIGESLTEIGARPVRGMRVPTVAQAADAKVAGPGITESVFQGTQEQEPSSAQTAQETARTEQSVLGEQPEHDLHEVARRMEPDLFGEYDRLSAQREEFRNWIRDYNEPPPETLQALQDERAAMQEQLDAHVAARGGYAAGPEARRLRAQIRSLDAEHAELTERAAAFQEGRAEETPELAQARQHLMATDFAIRDLSPQVSAAYRRAADAVGAGTVEPVPHVAPEAEITAPATPQGEQPPVAEQPIPTAETPQAAIPPVQDVPQPQAQKPLAEQKAFIASDVERQLIAAGRPAEEAQAAGQLIAARYAARAARMGGALGNAEELYRKEGAVIRGPGASRGGGLPSPSAPSAPTGPIGERAAPEAAAVAPEQVATPQEAPAAHPALEPVAAPADEPEPVAVRARAARGPRARDPQTYSLLEFLSDIGGLKKTPDLAVIFGDKNPFVPGFGRLFRKNGLSIDRAREAAVESGYLADEGRLNGGLSTSTERDLLDAIDAENRGQKQYRAGIEAPVKAVDPDEERHHMEGALDTALRDAEIDPETVSGKTRDRVLEIMQREGVHDPIVAWERAVMEEDQHGVDHDELPARHEDIPGWDVDESAAAPRAGGAIAESGTRETGEAARAGGAGDREPSSLSRTASWVIRDKATKQVVMETFDRKHVEHLNTKKYEAVPIGDYLGEINGRGGVEEPQHPAVADELEYFQRKRDRLPMDFESRMERAREQGFENGYFHGSARTDRLIEKGRIDQKRATSGPMPFFTRNPEMASNYAANKIDTSLPDSGEISSYFTVTPKQLGISGRTPYTVEQSWHFLPESVKQEIREKAKRVGYEDPDHASGPIVLHPPGVDATLSSSHYDWVLKHEARGNPLAALREMWHDGGNLVGNEGELAHIWKLAGYPYEISEKNAPWHEARGVMPVMLRMKNPLRTGNTEELSNKVVPALEEAFKRDRSRKQEFGADMWDKNVRFTPKEWVAELKQNLADGGAQYVWTSIPDKVTAELKKLGYDGIIDTGGKGGGPAHDVAIPFEPKQVRSVYAAFAPENIESEKLLAQAARGKINIAEGRKPIITLMKDANASTFIHETGHQWLEELIRDADHPSAPNQLKDDADTVLSWLGAHSAEDIKIKHHEKFARGFEQYMREGVAPSPELASVFAKFKQWLVQIYQTIKGLGKPINDDIRAVFDRMLAEEPQRTVIAPDLEPAKSLADIHEADATHTEPHEADAAMARVESEALRTEAEIPPEIANEIQAASERDAAARTAEPPGEANNGAGPEGQVGPDRGGAGTQSPSGGVGAQSPEVVGRGGEARPESNALPGPEQRRGSDSDRSHPLAPSPATLFGPDESPFVDKAGNIRLDNLTNDVDVRNAIRDAAEANDDFVGDRRGVVTDGQVMELADALGMDFHQLQSRKIGQAFNAEQIIAARKLLIQSATVVSEAMKKAAAGTDEDVMAYAQAKDRHQMIQAQVAGITAEAGRALRAFRNIAGTETAQNIDQFIKGATGKTLFQLRREAQLGLALDTPQQVSKFMNDARERSFGRMLLEYWVNGLISGPATHTTYMVGNALLALHKAGPETAAAALIGKARQALGREGNVVHLGEVKAQLAAGAKSIPAALEAAGSAFKTGVTTLLPGETPRALPFQPGTDLVVPGVLNEGATYHSVMGDAFGLVRGLRDAVVASAALAKAGGVEGAPLVGARYSQLGAIPDIEVRGMNVLPVGTAARLPGRAIAAIHSFFRTLNYSMAKNALAYRTAANEGLDGTALAARIGELRSSPTPEIMQQAVHQATELTLMGQGGDFMRRLSALTNATVKLPVLGETQLMKFIDPFVHIAGNVLKQSVIERTPIGILTAELRADLMGKNGNVAQDTAMARMLVGTGMAVVMGSLAAEGYASGSGPKDPRESAMWRLAGNQAHSVRIGDVWYDIHRLGPLGMLMGIAADMYEVAHLAMTDEFADAAAHFQHALVQNVLDESFVRGPAELIRAVEDSDRYGPQYIRNFLSSFVPYSVGMAQVARASDPYSRQARTVVDAMKAKVPGLSESLLPRRDIWGEPMPNRETLGAPGVSAIWMTHVSHDPVNIALLNLGIHPAQVGRKIRNVELTDQQFDDFARIAGRMTKQRLDVIVRSPDWATWPQHIQRNVVEEVIKQSREAARGLIMMKFPQVVRDATAARLEKFLD